MKATFCAVVLFIAATVALGQQGTTVNFNLVQVNHYEGQEKVDDSLTTPGKRIVIDLQNPALREKFLGNVVKGNVDVAPVVVNVETVHGLPGAPLTLPWETSAIVRTPSGLDSFRVSSSRTGCPGTEVRSSVAVAFATPKGWSDPPIRFGPLVDHTICPLGRGYQLEVSVTGDESPVVRLHEPGDMYGRR